MPPRQSRVLIDTNAIQAAHSCGMWNAIRKVFRLETAEHCLTEAVRLNRRGEKLIETDFNTLRGEITAHVVSDEQRTTLLLRLNGRVDLDDGERDLVAVALTLKDAWWLCGPDKATLRALHYLSLADRMCSLEEVARTAGHRVRDLQEQYTQNWLSSKRTRLALGEELI